MSRSGDGWKRGETVGTISNTGLLESFGNIPEREWNKMKRPYIAVFQASCQDGSYQETGARFFGKLYDGAYYTGYHKSARVFREMTEDIEKTHPELHREPPGAEDQDELICVYM